MRTEVQRIRTFGERQRFIAIANDGIHNGGAATSWEKAIRWVPAVSVIKQANAPSAIHDGVIHDQRVALVLHGNTAIGDVGNEIVKYCRRTFIPQHNAV